MNTAPRSCLPILGMLCLLALSSVMADDQEPQSKAPFLLVAEMHTRRSAANTISYMDCRVRNVSDHPVAIAYRSRHSGVPESWWKASKVYGATYHSSTVATVELVMNSRIRKNGVWVNDHSTNLNLEDPPVEWRDIPAGKEEHLRGSIIEDEHDRIDELEVILPYRDGNSIKTAKLTWKAADAIQHGPRKTDRASPSLAVTKCQVRGTRDTTD